jgi:hypothetical protein
MEKMKLGMRGQGGSLEKGTPAWVWAVGKLLCSKGLQVLASMGHAPCSVLGTICGYNSSLILYVELAVSWPV